MNDDTKKVPTVGVSNWASLPRAAKAIVYETLRGHAAHASADAAKSQVLNDIITNGVARDPSAIQVMQNVTATAFDMAIGELEANDPELCQHCGVYHDEDENEPHRDPKGLS